MSVTLPIIHFNDVYRVRQNDKKSGGTIGADQFAAKIQSIRESWGEPSDLANLPPPPPSDGVRDWSKHATARERKGLVLFSGDLYSPSVESSVTRGTPPRARHQCLQPRLRLPRQPRLGLWLSTSPDPHGAKQLSWLFSNVVDRSNATDSAQDKEDGGSGSTNWDEDLCDDDAQVAGTLRSWTTTVQGVKVGCIGIVEKEWIATVPNFPHGFVYRNMAKTALKLSQILRDPAGEACELVIAITHSRLPNDIDFANEVGAVANPDAPPTASISCSAVTTHIYYVGNGAAHYEGDAFQRGEPGTENDSAAMVVKSGTDFRDRDLSDLRAQARALRARRRRRTQAHHPQPQRQAIPHPGLRRLAASGQDAARRSSCQDKQVDRSECRLHAHALGRAQRKGAHRRVGVWQLCRRRAHELVRGGAARTRQPRRAQRAPSAQCARGRLLHHLRRQPPRRPGVRPGQDRALGRARDPALRGRRRMQRAQGTGHLGCAGERPVCLAQAGGQIPAGRRHDGQVGLHQAPGKRLVSVELLDNPLDTPASAQPKMPSTRMPTWASCVASRSPSFPAADTI